MSALCQVPNSPEDPRTLTFTLVHGTFAPQAQWARAEDSLLRRTLENRYRVLKLYLGPSRGAVPTRT